jgi:hypothetical protein
MSPKPKAMDRGLSVFFILIFPFVTELRSNGGLSRPLEMPPRSRTILYLVSVCKLYFVGLTIGLHSGGRRFALDPTSAAHNKPRTTAARVAARAVIRRRGASSDLCSLAFGFAHLPPGYAEWRSVGPCENVLGNQLRFSKRDFGRESFPHLGFQLMPDTSLARVRYEVTSVCRL